MSFDVSLKICRNERDCIRRHRSSADDLRTIDGGSAGHAWGSANVVRGASAPPHWPHRSRPASRSRRPRRSHARPFRRQDINEVVAVRFRCGTERSSGEVEASPEPSSGWPGRVSAAVEYLPGRQTKQIDERIRAVPGHVCFRDSVPEEVAHPWRSFGVQSEV